MLTFRVGWIQNLLLKRIRLGFENEMVVAEKNGS
jgi:hypothetical protein